MTYLNCAGRHPSGEAAFDAAMLRSMATNHAILELWGTLFPEGDGVHTFDVHYMMFPVALSTPARSGSASTTMRMSAKPSIAEIKRYLVNTRADLPAYFAVSAGVQAYDDRQWNQAVRFLCEWPLSEGYKVLWLAHTHHLLEQANETFAPDATPGIVQVTPVVACTVQLTLVELT